MGKYTRKPRGFFLKEKKDWATFRAFRNDVISQIRKRKIGYFDELTKKVSNSERFGNKDWWRFVNSILRRKNIGPEEIHPLCENGTILYADKETANTH